MVSLCEMGCRRKDHNGQVGAWNNGKEVPRWGVAEIQKMSAFAVCVWSNL